jgi:hypothetical protein
VFPDKGTLDTFSKMSEILLSLYGIKVKFLKSDWDPDAVEVLQPTWVKIYGLPAMASKEEVVKKVASLAGEPLVVDELSLIKTGPVRVKINSRDPHKLRGFVRIFFNLTRYEIRFLSKKYKEKSYPPSPPHYNAKDDFDNMNEEEGEDSDEDNDKKHRRGGDKQQEDKGQMQVVGGSGGGAKDAQDLALSVISSREEHHYLDQIVDAQDLALFVTSPRKEHHCLDQTADASFSDALQGGCVEPQGSNLIMSDKCAEENPTGDQVEVLKSEITKI